MVITKVKQNLTLLKGLLKNLQPKLNKFLYSGYYPAIIGLIALLSWSTGLGILGLIIYVITCIYLCLTQRDLLPLVPIGFLVITLFNDFNIVTSPISITFIVLGVASIVAHFFIFPIKKFFLGELFLPFIGITCAFAIGGVLSPFITEYLNGLIHIAFFGPLLMGIYVLFSQYVCPPERVNVKRYLCIALVSVGMATSLMLLVQEVNVITATLNEQPNISLMDIVLKYLPLAVINWGHINVIGSIVLISVPACLYLITKAKTLTEFLLPFIFAVFMYLLIGVCGSHGSFSLLTIFLPLLFIITIKNMLKFKRAFIYICISIVLIIFSLIVIIAEMKGASLLMLIQTASKIFFADNGRALMYAEAVELFTKYPIFGVGLGYYNDAYFRTSWLTAFNFHSTLFHVIATLGVVGFIAYAYYMFKRIIIVLGNCSTFNKFIYFSFFLTQAYGMIDCCEFTSTTMLILTLMLCVVEKINIKGSSFIPPLIDKKF